MPAALPDVHPSRKSLPAIEQISVLLIGLLPTAVALALFIFAPLFSNPVEAALVWSLCCGLFVLADLLADSIPFGQWAGYLQLAAMTAWLSLGLPAALGIVVCGAALAAAVRPYAAMRLQASRLFLPTKRYHLPLRILVSGAALLAAAGVYRLLNGQMPLLGLGTSDLLPLAAALGSGLAAAVGLGKWLRGRAGKGQGEGWSLAPRRLAAEILFLPLTLALPLILASAGVGIFGVVVGIVAAQAVRYRQVSLAAQTSQQLYQRSADLVQKLSLVNSSIQNAMFNVDQQEALKKACETAMAITQASKATIFLIQREQETLALVEAVGLNPFHQEAGRDLPYSPEHYPANPRIVSDSESLGVTLPLRDFARKAGFRALVEMPMRSGNVMLGYLTVYHDLPHPYDQTEIDLLEILANQLTAALDNTQLLRALETHAVEMTHLVHLSRLSTASLDLHKVAADVAIVLRQMLPIDWVMINLLENGHMRVIGTVGGGSDGTVTPQHFLRQLPEVRAMTEQDAPTPQVFAGDGEAISEMTRSFMTAYGLATLTMLPMMAHEQMFGVILLGTAKPRALSEREEQLMETAANQIATQIYNVREYRQTSAALNQQLQQLALIEDIVQQISSSHDFNEIIDEVFEAAVKTTQADMVALALVTEANDLWVIEQQYVGSQRKRHYSAQGRDQGIIGRVIQMGETLHVPDNREVDYYLPSIHDEYLSSLAVPLTKDNVPIGALDVESKQTGAFTKEQANFLKNLGSHAIISMDNARLLEALQHQIATLTSLRELSLTLLSAIETTSVSRAVLKTALKISRGQYAALFHYERKADQLIPLIGTERDQTRVTQGEIKVLAQAADRAAKSGEMQIFADVETAFPDQVPHPPQYPSLVAMPIVRGSDVDEVLCVAYEERQVFEERDLNTLNLLAIQAAGHLENATLHERIHDGNYRMRAILDSTRDGVILLDNSGRLIEVNPWAQRLIGLNLSEHVGEPLVETLLRYAEGSDEIPAGYSREELTKLARIQRLEPEGITRRQFSRAIQPGQIIHIEEVGSPVNDEHEHTVGRLLVLRDISEEKQLEAYREEVSGMVVHDLRAPLASIMSALQISLANLDNTAVVQQTMQISLGRAGELMDLVNSLLDIRKGKDMALERGPTSIAELIELARLTLMASIQKANVKVEVHLPPGLPLVNVDADKIRRVLINLLDNAIRFSPNGAAIWVVVKPDSSRGKLLVQVADSGKGIPRADQERIFDLYWQVKDNRPQRGSKGSGIGLAFCQRVLQAHGERIWVEEEGPLPGACFSFTLPLV